MLASWVGVARLGEFNAARIPSRYLHEEREAMGLLSRLFGRRDEIRQALVNPVAAGFPLGSDVVGIFSTGGYQDTGVAVNEMTALTASAVYACVAVISQAIAALPVHVKRKRDGGK